VIPDDFQKTLGKIQQYGIPDEDASKIHDRLLLAVQGVTAVEAGASRDLGLQSWASRLLQEFEAAVYKEICDPKNGCLNESYRNKLNGAMTPAGIEAVSRIVVQAVMSVNPAFAVSSVVIYLALWILKVGLNQWCSHPRS
jgi:hypothetical protein